MKKFLNILSLVLLIVVLTAGSALAGSAPIPEPGTIGLFGLGLFGLIALGLKRFKK